jgi:hypothetical protein
MHDRPVSSDICGHVDFLPGAADKPDVDVQGSRPVRNE